MDVFSVVKMAGIPFNMLTGLRRSTGRIPVADQIPDDMVSGLAEWKIPDGLSLKIFFGWGRGSIFFSIRSWPGYMLLLLLRESTGDLHSRPEYFCENQTSSGGQT